MSIKTQGIARSAISGMRWNYAGSLVSTVSSLVIGTVLARILGPGPFGQAIVATTIFSLANLFVDGGFSQALIQQKEISSEEIRRTFTCQVLIGMATTAVVYLAAPLIARLFHLPSAVQVVRVISLLMTFQALGLVSAALLRRDMRFRVVQYANLGSYLAGYLLLGIPLALLGAGVWSLVTAYLAQTAINTVVLYLLTRHPVTPSFGLPHRSIAIYGSTVMLTNLVNWSHANIDNLAASYRGPIALGLYGRSSNLAYQPANAMMSSLQSVLLSSSAKVQNKTKLLGQLALAAMVLALGILGPAYAVFVCSPATIIGGLYGAKWLAAIPLMVPLALAMPLFACIGLLNPIICGAGRPSLEFWPQAVTCVLAGVAYFSAIRISLAALAWALLGVMMVRFLLAAGVIFAALGVAWSRAAYAASGRLLFSAAFACVTWCFDRALLASGIAAGPRLAALFLVCVLLLAGSIWFRSEVVFGREAVSFLLQYASHLPPAYARQLRRFCDPGPPMVVPT
jgi:PST family polysaccharide transporter